ncbi:MAG: hypothetical protein OQJ81_11975 [Melioribacteraceae bacterium]|nr:hypothetical protein [Melioribacteraceae bacterium]
MKRIYRIFLLILFVPLIVFSQKAEYTVLTISGEVVLLNNNLKEVSDLNLGDKLYQQDNFALKKGGYLVLMNPELQSIELTNQGIYSISKIDTLISSRNNSISDNIAKFIFDEMSTSQEKYKEMKTLGSVVRSASNVIELATPKFGAIMDTLYNFKWYPLPNSSSYILRIFNKNGNTIFMRELSDTSFQLNLAEFNLEYGKEYIWTIQTRESLDRKLDSAEFKLMSPNDIKIVNQEFNNLKESFIDPDSPLSSYIIAKFFISKELYETALKYLTKCVNILPESKFYTSSHIQFLMDIGLSKEAMIAWNNSPFAKQSSE